MNTIFCEKTSLGERLYLDTKSHDFTIRCKDENGNSLKVTCHKFIIGKIPWFKKLFETEMKEKNYKEITITDFTFEDISLFVKTVYCDEAHGYIGTFIRLYKISDYFCHDNIKERCLKAISNMFNYCNVERAVEHYDPELYKLVKKYEAS